MRVVFLNTFNGKIQNKLLDFISKNSSTDVFCLQEVERPLFNKISKILKGYKSWMISKPYINSWSFNEAIFCKNQIESFCDEKDFLKIGSGLSVKIKYKNKEIFLLNIHGIAMPGDKLDNEERINQSKGILDFVKLQNASVVIGGDFNLMPNAKSIKTFEEAGYKNLIKEFDIKVTRSPLAWEYYKNDPGFIKQYFSDYVFVSPEIKVKNFEVPNIEVSDHFPLILDFEV